MDEAKRMGMSVLGPDINESRLKFNVNKDGNVRFGLGAIKGVGEGAVIKIIEERKENGPFKSIYDFVERVPLTQINKKTLEALATAGAFDNLGKIKRGQYFSTDNKESTYIENLIRYGNKFQEDKDSEQQSLFGGKDTIEIAKPPLPTTDDWPKLEKLKREKEIIGVYLSAHPLDDFKMEIEQFCNASLSDFDDLNNLRGRELTISGMVTEVKHAIAKNGNPYGFLTIQDYTDSYRFALFGKDYENFRKYCYEDYSLLIKGKVQPRPYRDNELEFKIKNIMLLSQVREELVDSISLSIPLHSVSDGLINEIKEFALSKKGKALLKFKIVDTEENIVVNMFSRSERIDITNELIDYLNEKTEIQYSIN